MALSFFVPGIPAPAGSKRAMPIYRGKRGEPRVFTGRAVVVEASTRAVPWRQDVQAAARQACQGQLSGPLQLALTFLVPRPKAHLSVAGLVKLSAPLCPVVTPDLTKLVRAVEDALTGIAWNDDCQVVWQAARKVYAVAGQQPGVYVFIEALSDRQTLQEERREVLFDGPSVFDMMGGKSK